MENDECKIDPPFHMRCDTPMERYRWETWDTKEPETIAWIDSFEPGTCFWDVGANIGIYSLYAGSLDRDIKILAFEPHEENNTKLHLNRDESRFMAKPDGFAKIEVLRFALGDRVGMGSMEVPDPSAGATGAQVRVSMHNGNVPLETIDHLVWEFPQYRAPDYVKIDIDGQELAVVRGMRRTLPGLKSALVEVSAGSRLPVCWYFNAAGFTWNNRFNTMSPHSRERRQREGIDAENIIFTR